MSEISKAMDRARRERGPHGESERPPGPGRVVSAALTQRLDHGDVEQYLSLASEVGLALPDVETRILLFVSAISGEGASTVAREFASTLAERGEAATLLVDANLRRPSVHDAFCIRRDPGLTDYVLGGSALDECLRETTTPRLTVLPSGRPVIAPPRVIGDERTRELISELRGRFRFVVIDAPPVLTYPEGVQLSGLCDGVALVVRAGHTRRQLPARALDLLDEAGATTLGTVLNRRRFYIPRFVYDRI